MFSYRKAFYIAVTLFWLVTMGMLMQRHYGTFHLSGRFEGPSLQSSFTPSDISEEQWMGVYLNGEKIGYLSRKTSPAPNGYTMDEAFRIKMIVMDTEKDVETLLNANLDNNLKLLSFTAKIKGDLDIGISGSVQAKDLSLTIDSSGVKTTKVLHLSKEPTLEGFAMTKMLRGLKPGDRISVPIFDPALMGVEDLELKVVAKENIMSLMSFKTDSPLLPGFWITETVLPILSGKPPDIFYLLVLLSNTAFFSLVSSAIGMKIFRKNIEKLQPAGRSPGRGLLGGFYPDRGSAVFYKDIQVFFRDTGQWSQVTIIGALVMVYIYNFKSIPLDAMAGLTPLIKELMLLTNMLMAGLVLSAVAARFLYTSVSLEGEAFWIIRTSPLNISRFLWSKFLYGCTAVTVLIVLVVFLTNLALHVTGILMYASVGTTLLLCISVSAWHRIGGDLPEIQIRKYRLCLDKPRRHGLHGAGVQRCADHPISRSLDLLPLARRAGYRRKNPDRHLSNADRNNQCSSTSSADENRRKKVVRILTVIRDLRLSLKSFSSNQHKYNRSSENNRHIHE